MKYVKRGLAWLLTVCMVLSVFTINGIVAKADGDGTVWLEFRGNSVTKISDNAVQYTVDGNTWVVTISGLGSFQWRGGSTEIENIPVGTPLTFTLSGEKLSDGSVPAPKLNISGESMSFHSEDGYAITKSFDTAGGPNMIELVAGSSGGSQGGGGQGGGDQGGGGQGGGTPAGAEVTAKVSWNGEFGEIKIGGTNISGIQSGGTHVSTGQETLTAHLESDDTITVIVQAEFLENYNSIKINDVEKFTTSASDGRYTFQIPKTDIPVVDEKLSINIVAVKTVSTQHTIVWAYDNSMGADAKVENGTVQVVSGVVENNPGHCVAEEDAIITIKLIPAYGYQVVGAKINGDVDLFASDVAGHDNEFTFAMPHVNVHFQGIFTKTSDIVANTSSAVSGATFDGSNVATTGGTARMTIANATPASTASVSGVDTTKSVQAVDITMDQLFYKNTAFNVWSTNKKELSSAAEVSLTVTQGADGYTVLRTHDGVVEEIPANYDPSTNKITFASAKYSTYTLVPLKKSNNTYVPEEKKETKSESKGEEVQKPVVVEEVIKDVKQVTVDKTALALQTEQLIPTTTFNFTSVKTFKGFVTSIEKASQKTLKADPKAKVVSIYTNKPFCFNRNILEAMRKTNQTFVYYFMHKNHLYSVTVPAGTDPSKVLEKNGCAGPLYIGKVLGTTVLIK